MEEEREHLIKEIFPKIRAVCQKRSVTFTDIDLRWGITEEQAQDGGAVAICLEEIDRCRPYFIGLIGERYGWIPNDDNAKVLVKPEIANTVKEWCDKGRSVTEMEMIYGVLNKPEQAPYSYFYFCDQELTKQKEQRSVDSMDNNATHDIFYDDSTDKQAKLATLKTQIRTDEASWSVADYETIEALGQKIETELLAIIDKEFPVDDAIDAISLRRQKHDFFAEGRRRGYIADEQEITSLIEQVESKGKPIVITGEMGTGKSALMATLAERWHELHPNSPVIAHYAGAGDESSVISIIDHILNEINQQYQLEKEIPSDLFIALPEWLALIPEEKPLYLILDGINQYTGDTRRLISILPEDVGSSVRILVSALDSQELDYLEKRAWPLHTAHPLNETRRTSLVSRYLDSFNKTLPDNLVKQISESVQSGNPLYLKILLNELCVDARHETLSKRINLYLEAKSVTILYQRVITRWQEDYGNKLTEKVLSLIWCSRYGLSYDELRNIVESNQLELSRLIFGFGEHLIEIGGLHTFMHDALRQAVSKSFLTKERQKTESRLQIVIYFLEQQLSNRLADEVPWILEKDNSPMLGDYVTDWRMVLLHSSRHHGLYELYFYWRSAKVETKDAFNKYYHDLKELRDVGIREQAYKAIAELFLLMRCYKYAAVNFGYAYVDYIESKSGELETEKDVSYLGAIVSAFISDGSNKSIEHAERFSEKLEEVVQKVPFETSSSILRSYQNDKAIDLLEAKKPKEALTIIDETIKKIDQTEVDKYQYSFLLNTKACILVRLKEMKDAIVCCDTALNLLIDDGGKQSELKSNLYAMRAFAADNSGNYGLALESSSRAQQEAQSLFGLEHQQSKNTSILSKQLYVNNTDKFELKPDLGLYYKKFYKHSTSYHFENIVIYRLSRVEMNILSFEIEHRIGDKVHLGSFDMNRKFFSIIQDNIHRECRADFKEWLRSNSINTTHELKYPLILASIVAELGEDMSTPKNIEHFIPFNVIRFSG